MFEVWFVGLGTIGQHYDSDVLVVLHAARGSRGGGSMRSRGSESSGPGGGSDARGRRGRADQI